MKITKQQLKEMVQRAIKEEWTPEQEFSDPDMQLLNQVEEQFEAAIEKIFQGVEEYQKVMRTIAKLAQNQEVKRLGRRGYGTASNTYEQWRAIQDDLLIMRQTVKGR